MNTFINFITLPYVLGALCGLVGVVLGYLIRIWLNKRDLQLAHDQRIIEGHTKAMHQYVEQYYLNFISKLTLVGDSLEQIQGRRTCGEEVSAEKIAESFFDVARYLSMDYRWGKEIGGILMLGSLTAEELILQLDRMFRGRLLGDDGILSSLDEAHVRKEIDPDELRTDFNRKVKTKPLEDVSEGYKEKLERKNDSWLKSLTKCLQCYRMLFLFEINDCYKAWYGQRPAFAEVGKRLVELNKDEVIDTKDVEKYFREKTGKLKGWIYYKWLMRK